MRIESPVVKVTGVLHAAQADACALVDKRLREIRRPSELVGPSVEPFDGLRWRRDGSQFYGIWSASSWLLPARFRVDVLIHGDATRVSVTMSDHAPIGVRAARWSAQVIRFGARFMLVVGSMVACSSLVRNYALEEWVKAGFWLFWSAIFVAMAEMIWATVRPRNKSELAAEACAVLRAVGVSVQESSPCEPSVKDAEPRPSI